MPRPKIRPVSPDEVKISRDGDSAVFVYADEATMGGGMNLKIGDKIHKMTDSELLKLHNEMAEGMQMARMSYENIAVEVPPGKPQIKYDRRTETWSPKGDVLRCYITSRRRDGESEPMIEIDKQKLTWEEFGRSLLVHEGWGMRITFCPDDEMHEQPEIVIADSRQKYMDENR
jgi:hypothetical protein